jgi:hypothetical protein
LIKLFYGFEIKWIKLSIKDEIKRIENHVFVRLSWLSYFYGKIF